MKKILCLIVVLFGFLAQSVRADEPFDVFAKHAIAIEQSTGKILYDKDSNTSAGIASITKILTVYMVYKEIEAGRLSWKDKVSISDYPYELTTNYETSNVPMEARKYTVKQLVDAAMIASANSAAIALAEKIGGTEPKFVDMMKKQLDDWGITDYKLVNASGLNNASLGEHIYPGSDPNDENMMSAKSVAIIAKHLITDFPQILKISAKTSQVFADTTMTTYNYMLPGQAYAREGVDGLKTGTTALAGASFVATATENSMRIISVILNADNSDVDPNARFIATAQVLNYVSQNYQLRTLLQKDDDYQQSRAKVIDGKAKTVPIVAQKDFIVVEKIVSQNKGKLKIKTAKNGYTASIKKGDKLGQAIYVDRDLVGDGYLTSSPPRVSLVAEREVKRSFFLKVWWNHFVNYVNDYL